MLQRDYLLEVIARFVEALMRAFRLAIEKGDEQGCKQVEQAVADLLELDPDTFSVLAPNSLVQLMELSGIGESVSEYVGYALDRVADVYEDMGDGATAELRRAQAEAIEAAYGGDLTHVPEELDELDRELFG
jgi:hypothetical protein